MIRVVLFLAAVAVLALGAAWLADRPGDVAISWLGYRIETSVMVLTVAIVAVAIMAVLLWSLFRALLRSPASFSAFLRNRRAARGYLAISHGLIAIGSGDVRAAKRFADQARRIAADEPLALLLSAQTAQLAGDRAGAERTFRHMAGRDDTKLLGLHGLFIEAQRREDMVAARVVAEDAATAEPSLAWAAQAVLEFRCAEGDWTGALAALDSNAKNGLVDKATHRRQRAVLLTARALSGEDRETAKTHVLEAVKLCPGLVPAAALAGRLLAEAGEMRRAGRILEAAWRVNPHPDLAEAYAHLRPGDSARDRLARVQALGRVAANNVEGAIAVARAAIDAHEFTIARTAIAPLLAEPTQRVALLMAELEEAESGDVGRAREWMARALHAARDPAWTTDGVVSEKWMPVSPMTGHLDAFQWKVPLADLTGGGRVIDQAEPVAATPIPAPAPPAEEAPETGEPAVPAAEAKETPLPAVLRQRAAPAAGSRAVEAVIPLVHVPDDPGPEAAHEVEPAPEPPPDGWRRLRALFR